MASNYFGIYFLYNLWVEVDNYIICLFFVGDYIILFIEVVFEVMRYLDGVYVFIFKSRYYLNELIVCKYGGLLFFGVKVS